MLVKEMDEASIQAIGHAFGYYDYGPEKKGLIACFRSPDAAAEYHLRFRALRTGRRLSAHDQ